MQDLLPEGSTICYCFLYTCLLFWNERKIEKVTHSGNKMSVNIVFTSKLSASG